jgi:hypothetical protein
MYLGWGEASHVPPGVPPSLVDRLDSTRRRGRGAGSRAAADLLRTPHNRASGIRDTNIVLLLRVLLAKCPDEAPSPGTAELLFVTDADLRESIQRDISAANQDAVNGEWKGATVLGRSRRGAKDPWDRPTCRTQRIATPRRLIVAALVAARDQAHVQCVANNNMGGAQTAWFHPTATSCRPLGIGNPSQSPRLCSAFRARSLCCSAVDPRKSRRGAERGSCVTPAPNSHTSSSTREHLVGMVSGHQRAAHSDHTSIGAATLERRRAVALPEAL